MLSKIATLHTKKWNLFQKKVKYRPNNNLKMPLHIPQLTWKADTFFCWNRRCQEQKNFVYDYWKNSYLGEKWLFCIFVSVFDVLTNVQCIPFLRGYTSKMDHDVFKLYFPSYACPFFHMFLHLKIDNIIVIYGQNWPFFLYSP